MTRLSGSGTLRIALRSARDPWDSPSVLETYRRNLFRNNVGNLVFSHAVHRALSTRRAVVSSNRFAVTRAEAARLNAEADVFVVPLANAFRPSFADALDRLSRLIEQLRIPVVVVGVAAQGSVDDDWSRLDAMSDRVRRFVSAVLDRSASIGVRGSFTADYLASLGFRDVEVIGCPAMFVNGPSLELRAVPSGITSESAVSIGVSPYLTPMRDVLDRTLDRYPDLTYIAQDIVTLGVLVTGRVTGGTTDALVDGRHRVFAEDKVRFFVDPVPWREHLAARDFYFGSRIHGSMMALTAGTPAVVLTHDSRTKELAEVHRIPMHRLSDIGRDTAEDLLAAADFAPLLREHPQRFEAYRAFLERNGLPHIWEPGESGEAFDQQVAAVEYPGAVRSPSGLSRVRANAMAMRVSLGRHVGRVRRAGR